MTGQVPQQVGVDAQGNFVVVWTQTASASFPAIPHGVYARRFRADGTPLGNDFRVNPVGLNGNNAVVAMKQDGAFIVAWEGTDGTGSTGVFAQRFASNGSPIGGVIAVNNATAGNQQGPTIDVSAAGDFVIGWISAEGSPFEWNAYARRFRADGVPYAGQFAVSPQTAGFDLAGNIQVDMAEGGDFVLAWDQYDQSNPGTLNVLARHYRSNGTPNGNIFQVNGNATPVAQGQGDPDVGIDSQGIIQFVWWDEDLARSNEQLIYGRTFAASQQIADGFADISGRNGTTGTWWTQRSTGSAFVNESFGSWSSTITWQDVLTGDFNGDGIQDRAGRGNGNWWVSRSDGDRFANQYWGRWSTDLTWIDVAVADINGDGLDDIVGRTNGYWWVAQSNGQRFINRQIGRWSETGTWQDVSIGDFDGDGNDDIAGRLNGYWWVSRSNGQSLQTGCWGRWTNSGMWQDVAVGDFDGNGKADIAGRLNGNWFVARLNGSSLLTSLWGRWSTSIPWENVDSGDFS